MNEKCLNVEELAVVAALDANDSRRRHTERCPRCGGLLAAYESFILARGVEGADPERAERSLARAIASATGARDARPHPPRARQFRIPLRSLAAAAVVVVVAAFALWRWQPSQTDRALLRGSTGENPQIALSPAAVSRDGIELAWHYPDADGYEVILYSADLEELFRMHTTAPHAHIGRGDLPETAWVPGSTLFWRVLAMSHGDPVITSPAGGIRIP